MFLSHPARWIVALVCSSLLVASCSTDTAVPEGETGSLSLNLVIGDGIVINRVDWTITGNDMDMSGTIDVSAPGSTASVEVFGLPPGEEHYTVTLAAVSEDGEVSCQGSTDFNVEVDEVTDVMVVLKCKLPQRLGSVRVNGKFNICAELTKATAAPLQTSVGNDIDLTSQAEDADGDPIAYIWTATSGSIADPSAASTTYTCTEAGDHFITIQVTDDDEYCDMATWTFAIACVPGDGECQSDAECGDGNQCTVDACFDGACSNPNAEAGATCDQGGGSVCDGQGNCVDCNTDADCATGEVCTANACVPEAECTIDSECDDGNDCTANTCTAGECSSSNEPADTTCTSGGGTVCDGNGACVACNSDSQCDAGEVCTNNTCVLEAECTIDSECDDGNDCTADTCAAGTCVNTNQPADSACTMGGTVCDGNGACVACNSATQCPGGGECQVPACESNACALNDAPDGTACLDNTGTCNAGVCEPNEVCEYTQDFESLTLPPPGQTDFPPNSLSEDGWLVGGNEFESDGTFFNSYFSFPAPNGGPAFSAVVADQGGPPQGAQQMSIYNDYNNANHGDGPPDLNRIIEAVVFRERDIVAADVGNTICFTFDAKKGNIEGASTAEAFVQVLDKINNTFQVLADDVQDTDTTAFDNWQENITLCVPIDGSLEGQLLQYGGRSRASNFEGSGIFYDNMSVCSAPTP